MPKRSCPHCARRLPYAGRRCIHCGWVQGAVSMEKGKAIPLWRRARVVALALLMCAAAVTHFAYRNASALADWYAGFAARFLPDTASSLALDDTETGAYFYCARQVARKMSGQFSVETFDGARSRTVALGSGRYRVESAVDEAKETGEQIRHDFTCVARFEAGRWVLEELQVQSLATRVP